MIFVISSSITVGIAYRRYRNFIENVISGGLKNNGKSDPWTLKSIFKWARRPPRTILDNFFMVIFGISAKFHIRDDPRRLILRQKGQIDPP